MSAVEIARRNYAEWSDALLRGHPMSDPRWKTENPINTCFACNYAAARVDAASIALDMAEAERLSGRNPRGALSREIPL